MSSEKINKVYSFSGSFGPFSQEHAESIAYSEYKNSKSDSLNQFNILIFPFDDAKSIASIASLEWQNFKPEILNQSNTLICLLKKY